MEYQGRLASANEPGIIGTRIWPLGLYREEDTVAIDENTLTKGQVRKLNALRKSVGDKLGEEVFGKWLAQQAAAEPKPDPVSAKIEEALAGFVDNRTFRLGNYGYTIRRTREKGKPGFVATKNEKPR